MQMLLQSKLVRSQSSFQLLEHFIQEGIVGRSKHSEVQAWANQIPEEKWICLLSVIKSPLASYSRLLTAFLRNFTMCGGILMLLDVCLKALQTAGVQSKA